MERDRTRVKVRDIGQHRSERVNRDNGRNKAASVSWVGRRKLKRQEEKG